MEFEVSYSLDNEQQFWDELSDIVSAECSNHESIDNSLRSFLAFTTKFRDDYLGTHAALHDCSSQLLRAPVFTANSEYVRRQIIYCLLQEEDPPTLHILATFLLHDGKRENGVFEMMQAEGAFPRIIELLQSPGPQDDVHLHQTLLALGYEMGRVQRLGWEDITAVDDGLVLLLFRIIEELSYDANDSYHFPVIRFLLVLNEQYMVHSTESQSHGSSLPNRVMKALAVHGHKYKSFGENIILLLNRESETSQQLLILKLLYLLFSAPATAEYFYTNDLHVLVDVILRNLLDLPPDELPPSPLGTNGHDKIDKDLAAPLNSRTTPITALRHTYLRVLHPLLANSQIQHPDHHYKRDEILQLLLVLRGTQGLGIHFAPADPTTVRLTQRCLDVEWLGPHADAPPDEEARGNDHTADHTKTPPGEKEVAQRMLGMSVRGGAVSSVSFVEMASQKEKPGVKTPRRRRPKPPPPPAPS